MTRKQRRMAMLGAGAVFLAGSATLVGTALNDSIVFFFAPTELMAETVAQDRPLRTGGLVRPGSLVRGDGETIRFVLTDNQTDLPVTFTGVLPDLFREGQGVVAEGFLRAGVFEAEEILAKHDENYMPKEIADTLKEKGHWQEGTQ